MPEKLYEIEVWRPFVDMQMDARGTIRIDMAFGPFTIERLAKFIEETVEARPNCDIIVRLKKRYEHDEQKSWICPDCD